MSKHYLVKGQRVVVPGFSKGSKFMFYIIKVDPIRWRVYIDAGVLSRWLRMKDLQWDRSNEYWIHKDLVKS